MGEPSAAGQVPDAVVEIFWLRGRIEALEAVAAIVRGMKHYLMLGEIHDEQHQEEILDKFGAINFQHMAFLAYELAEAAFTE